MGYSKVSALVVPLALGLKKSPKVAENPLRRGYPLRLPGTPREKRNDVEMVTRDIVAIDEMVKPFEEGRCSLDERWLKWQEELAGISGSLWYS
ncbi:hypothetical protein GP486_000175 [Trichoglossum hirsutum]|uniref:Uncharacterized protein n=1 Tax=Trichoglossum hirsutum TaxID=265104 RepID=A0A9P8LJE1_9PEZI|nr:hypothetical protein GP486_000175 [Trichoglossum hirsutum]